jgi:hypothetical protein
MKLAIFRTNFTTFRRNRHARGGGVFICVKNNITCSELRFDDDFEIIAVEVKGSDSKDVGNRRHSQSIECGRTGY